LSNRIQRVLVEGVMTSWSDVISGVPRGTVVGLLLFLLFINDLQSCSGGPWHYTCRLFADDCLLYRDPQPRWPTAITA